MHIRVLLLWSAVSTLFASPCGVNYCGKDNPWGIVCYRQQVRSTSPPVCGGGGAGWETKLKRFGFWKENKNKNQKFWRNQTKSIYSAAPAAAAAVPKIQYGKESGQREWDRKVNHIRLQIQIQRQRQQLRIQIHLQLQIQIHLQLQLQIQIHLFWITNRIRSFGSQSLCASQSIFMCASVFYVLRIKNTGGAQRVRIWMYVHCMCIHTFIHTEHTYVHTYVDTFVAILEIKRDNRNTRNERKLNEDSIAITVSFRFGTNNR